MMFFRFLKSFLRYQWRKLRGLPVIADPGVQLIRHVICDQCEWNKDEQCQKCKCLIQSKVMLDHEDCPLGYWPK